MFQIINETVYFVAGDENLRLLLTLHLLPLSFSLPSRMAASEWEFKGKRLLYIILLVSAAIICRYVSREIWRVRSLRKARLSLYLGAHWQPPIVPNVCYSLQVPNFHRFRILMENCAKRQKLLKLHSNSRNKELEHSIYREKKSSWQIHWFIWRCLFDSNKYCLLEIYFVWIK